METKILDVSPEHCIFFIDWWIGFVIVDLCLTDYLLISHAHCSAGSIWAEFFYFDFSCSSFASQFLSRCLSVFSFFCVEVLFGLIQFHSNKNWFHSLTTFENSEACKLFGRLDFGALKQPKLPSRQWMNRENRIESYSGWEMKTCKSIRNPTSEIEFYTDSSKEVLGVQTFVEIDSQFAHFLFYRISRYYNGKWTWAMDYRPWSHTHSHTHSSIRKRLVYCSVH